MVNAISFRGNAMESAKDILEQPQAFTTTKQPDAKSAPKTDTFEGPKKKHSFAKGVTKTVIAAGVVAAGLAVTHHYNGFQTLIDKIGVAEEGSTMAAIKKGAAKALTYLDVAGEFVKDKSLKAYDAVKGLIAKKAPETEEV